MKGPDLGPFSLLKRSDFLQVDWSGNQPTNFRDRLLKRVPKFLQFSLV
jgi:hypothetical protein